MARKTKHKRNVVANVPQTPDQANTMIRQIGNLHREAARIELDMNAQLAQVREEHEARAQPVREQAAAMIDAVQVWAEANRNALTKGGKTKTAALPAGDILWRITPPSVSVKGVDAVLQRLRAAFAGLFIRTKEEVDKEAILATPTNHPVRQLEGITINQREEFVVQPHDAELSEVA